MTTERIEDGPTPDAASSSGSRSDRLIAQARLSSGLILFAYVLSHLANHMLGLWSIEAMQWGLGWFLALWGGPTGTVLLYGGLVVHLLIALRAVVLRDRFRDMSRAEMAQLGLGLAIPLLLIDHAIATRGAYELYGVNADYIYVLHAMWNWLPWQAAKQSVAVVVAWVHGCIGLHFWLRYKSGYRRLQAWLLALAVIVPTLSLAGFTAAGMEIRQRAAEPGWTERAVASMNLPEPEEVGLMYRLIGDGRTALVWLILGAFAANIARGAYHRRNRVVELRYGTGRMVRATRGLTVLETSRMHGIPHASVCGGRGRCSTCRIRVGSGLDRLPPPGETERKVLRRIGAPPNVRLACQTRVIEGLEITPLLPPHAGVADGVGGPSYRHGRELEIAVLFADIRGFTTISEQRLPYDVVFILNRYFAEMGAAIEGAGGRLDKFVGDGVMALFGVDSDPATGSRQALAAARAMAGRLVELNASLEGELPVPLRIGIGIHVGPCIVGEMGYGQVRGLTAVGDTVNTASRLEGLTKEQGVQLVVSEALAERAGCPVEDARRAELPIRGRSEPLVIRCIEDARALALSASEAPR